MKQNNALATFIDDKYIPLDKKYKLILAIILFLLPTIAFYYFSYNPQAKKYNLQVTQRSKLEAELEKAKARAADIDSLRAELADTENKFNEASLLLPKEKEIPALLTNISALGRGAGLDFLTFKPQADIPKDFYSEIPIDIKLRGPYHNVGVFLDQVSKLERIVTVSDINMGGPKQEANDMLLDSSCRLVTYRFTNIKRPVQDNKGKKGKKRR